MRRLSDAHASAPSPEATPSHRERLVIFAGPHKSASSSIQEFLVRYMSGRPKYQAVSQGWKWPKIDSKSVKRVPERKVFAQLVSSNDTELHEDILRGILDGWQQTENMVLASEEFDRFGTTPWSQRDGMKALRKIVDRVKPPQLDIVVNYRTPRHKQWISIWKQLTALANRKKPGSETVDYKYFICQDERAWEFLDCVANPLGLVKALRSNGWNTTLMDMGGVEEQGLDIAHASACSVLQLDCVDGWVKGTNRTLMLFNTKNRELGVTDHHLQEMEWLFRKRDCAYASQLENDGGVRILFHHSLWKDCDFETDAELHEKLGNTTFLLGLLQAQVGCSAAGRFAANVTQWIKSATSTATTRTLDATHDTRRSIEPAENRLFVLQMVQLGVLLFLFQIFRWRRRRRV